MHIAVIKMLCLLNAKIPFNINNLERLHFKVRGFSEISIELAKLKQK